MSKVASFIRGTKAGSKPTVIALHCSGATGAEWRQLECDLGSRFSLIAPDLIGSGSSAHWGGEHAFRLSDEAKNVIRIIDAANGPVHLVGHSYGGAVAMRIALERPTQVASVSLYEPVAFHVLKQAGADGKAALEEITALAEDIRQFVLSGNNHAAAKRFVEYWNGADSWAALPEEARDDLVRYIPKVCLEFSATLSERTPLYAYRRLNIPTLLLHGEYTSEPMKIIARLLGRAMKFASLQTVYGAGHMGPFSHALVVSAMMADWIVRAEPSISADERDRKLAFEQVA